jgi:hypothetical protein
MATKRTLRVCTTTVTTDGRAEWKSNDERVAWARELIATYAHIIDLLVLPAGYLRSRSEGEVREVAAPIIDAARKTKIAVILGVDSQDAPATVEKVRRSALPYFLVAWSPRTPRPIVWRQRSTTSADAREAPDATAREPRLLPIKRARVAAVACGEIFSASIRKLVREHVPDLAVLAAHTASGARHWAAQRSLARLGVPSLRSVHAKSDARNVLDWREEKRPSLMDGFPRARPGAPFKLRLLATLYNVD